MNPDPRPETAPTPDGPLMRVFGLVRIVVMLGVASSLILASALYISSLVEGIHGIYSAVTAGGDEDVTKALLYLAVTQADSLLVATALLITGFGLYSLFIGRPEQMPSWLKIDSLDELKHKLIGVVVAALAVDYFSTVYEGANVHDLLIIGGGTAAMIAALGFFLRMSQH